MESLQQTAIPVFYALRLRLAAELAEFTLFGPIFFNSATAPFGSPLLPFSSYRAWMQGPQMYDHAGVPLALFNVLRSVVPPEAS